MAKFINVTDYKKIGTTLEYCLQTLGRFSQMSKRDASEFYKVVYLGKMGGYRDNKNEVIVTMDAFACYTTEYSYPNIWLGVKGSEF